MEYVIMLFFLIAFEYVEITFKNFPDFKKKLTVTFNEILKTSSICFISCFLFFLQELPPYNGFGLIEDSAQNCFALIPKAPQKDVIKMLMNENKVLRYLATLVRTVFVS